MHFFAVHVVYFIVTHIKDAWSDPIGFFSKLLPFSYHKNSYIFLVIILKFHAIIPSHSEEKIKKRAYFIDYGGISTL